MRTYPQTGARSSAPPQNWARAACAGAFGLASLALTGWVFGLPGLTYLIPGFPAMNPLTSICLLLASASLWNALEAEPGSPTMRLARALAAVSVGLAGLRLTCSAFGAPWQPDLMLFRDQLLSWLALSRMGPNTAAACFCLAAGLLTVDYRTARGWRWSDGFLFAATALSLVTLIGYLYAVAPMHGIMAVGTATAIGLVAVGGLLGRPDHGLVRLLTSDSPGGMMARRVLPPGLIAPIALGWLRLQGQHLGLYGLELGTALLMLTIVVGAAVLIWVTATNLEKADLERRSAQEALRVSLQRQSLALDANLIGVLTANVDGRITEANPAFLEMIGYRSDELPLRTETITPPEWRGFTDIAIREIAERGVATPFEKEYLRRDGTRVPVLVGAAALPDGSGEVMAFVVDLSGRKQAQLEMERMRLFLDSIIENLPSMIFVKDAKELRFVRLNRAGEELLGFGREAFIGKNDHDFFPAEEADAFIAKDREVLATGEMIDIAEEPIQTHSGETRILHTKKVPILDPQGIPQFLLGISEDITHRKQAEKELDLLNRGLQRRTSELETANRELEAFSYSVSHDLRAPLRHIHGFADLLTREAGATLSEKGRRYLDTISDSARRMGRLIDDLLAFSRMGRSQMQDGHVDLGALVADVQRTLEPETAGRDVVWKVAPLPVVRGDTEMLRMVFTNLLANALKYSSRCPQSVIEVGARQDMNEVIVFVRDNGVGFDMDYLHMLFGVFQRLHSESEFEGTGIGLANVRRVIHRHGGRAWAEGVVNGGATFYVALPGDPERIESKEAA